MLIIITYISELKKQKQKGKVMGTSNETVKVFYKVLGLEFTIFAVLVLIILVAVIVFLWKRSKTLEEKIYILNDQNEQNIIKMTEEKQKGVKELYELGSNNIKSTEELYDKIKESEKLIIENLELKKEKVAIVDENSNQIKTIEKHSEEMESQKGVYELFLKTISNEVDVLAIFNENIEKIISTFKLPSDVTEEQRKEQLKVMRFINFKVVPEEKEEDSAKS
jgi:hypothetical protein